MAETETEKAQRQVLIELRQKVGCSQQEVAHALGLDRSLFSRWESGYHQWTQPETVARIAEFLTQRLQEQHAEGQRLLQRYRYEANVHRQGVNA